MCSREIDVNYVVDRCVRVIDWETYLKTWLHACACVHGYVCACVGTCILASFYA